MGTGEKESYEKIVGKVSTIQVNERNRRHIYDFCKRDTDVIK